MGSEIRVGLALWLAVLGGLLSPLDASPREDLLEIQAKLERFAEDFDPRPGWGPFGRAPLGGYHTGELPKEIYEHIRSHPLCSGDSWPRTLELIELANRSRTLLGYLPRKDPESGRLARDHARVVTPLLLHLWTDFNVAWVGSFRQMSWDGTTGMLEASQGKDLLSRRPLVLKSSRDLAKALEADRLRSLDPDGDALLLAWLRALVLETEADSAKGQGAAEIFETLERVRDFERPRDQVSGLLAVLVRLSTITPEGRLRILDRSAILQEVSALSEYRFRAWSPDERLVFWARALQEQSRFARLWVTRELRRDKKRIAAGKKSKAKPLPISAFVPLFLTRLEENLPQAGPWFLGHLEEMERVGATDGIYYGDVRPEEFAPIQARIQALRDRARELWGK